MTEEAGISKLWQGFHHLSENNKDLVLTITKAIEYSEQDTQVIPERVGDIYGCVSQKGEK